MTYGAKAIWYRPSRQSHAQKAEHHIVTLWITSVTPQAAHSGLEL